MNDHPCSICKNPIASRGFGGHVKPACPWLRPDGALPLLAQRNALLRQRQIALLKSQSKLASLISDDLRRLTHSILKEGMR